MEKTNKKIDFKEVIYWVMAMVPFILSLIFYSRLPAMVPTHWGADNQINGYSSRNMAAFGLPALMLFLAVMVNVLIRIDPHSENIKRSGEIRQITRWFVVIVGIVVQLVILLAGIGMNIKMGSVALVFIAVLFVAFGNYLPKCKHNYTIGIRLPWTLADEENWTRTHRLAGPVWMIGGILMMILGFLQMQHLFMAVAFISVLIPGIYSYCIYRKKTR